MLLYAATIFVGAFLLFVVQPIIAKQILPWFGGSAAVWATCMVFFQSVLLFGYAYSDWTTRRLAPRRQAFLHVGLLAASLALLPIVPDAGWKPAGEDEPVLQILGLLAATIGLPYFLLATTGPLVQAWFTRRYPTERVYRLFALSNFASLLALLAYPPLIEPWIPTRVQSLAWSGTYAAFVVLCALAAFSAAPRGVADAAAPPHPAANGPSPTAGEQVLWLVLAGLGTYLLLGVTAHITQNVASVPFLWILPLALYLLSFILCFEGRNWYRRVLFLGPLAVALVAMAWGLDADGEIMDVVDAVPLYSAGLFVCCMFLHGELAARKPAPAHLTRFYLMVSLGGALGGVLIAVVAPLVFPTYYELAAGLVATALVAVRVLWPLPKLVPAAALAVSAACGWYGYKYLVGLSEGTLLMTRSFYGTLRVKDSGGQDDPTAMRRLMHGVIMHGEQYLAPDRMGDITTYYGPNSGVGIALRHFRDRPIRVGVVGLGTGTLAAWGKPGDVFRFYELDPDVLHVARTYFSFLSLSKAKVEFALGDARLSLERERPQGFDLLVIDAFSSDSIPVHLLTREALAAYLRHMKPGGIVAFHVTNRYLDLAPVVERVAQSYQLEAALVSQDPTDEESERYSSTDWVLVTGDSDFLQSAALAGARSPIPPRERVGVWTDDFNNLLRILK